MGYEVSGVSVCGSRYRADFRWRNEDGSLSPRIRRMLSGTDRESAVEEAEWMALHDLSPISDGSISLGEAIEEYIASKEGEVSPLTAKGYRGSLGKMARASRRIVALAREGGAIRRRARAFDGVLLAGQDRAVCIPRGRRPCDGMPGCRLRMGRSRLRVRSGTHCVAHIARAWGGCRLCETANIRNISCDAQEVGSGLCGIPSRGARLRWRPVVRHLP